jgi:hypothetical protein
LSVPGGGQQPLEHGDVRGSEGTGARDSLPRIGKNSVRMLRAVLLDDPVDPRNASQYKAFPITRP